MSPIKLSCPICAEIYTNADVVYSTTCGHIYHLSCMQRWKSRSTSCPECRQYNPDSHRIYLNFETDDDREDSEHQLNVHLESYKMLTQDLKSNLQRSESDFLQLQSQYHDIVNEIKVLKETNEYLRLQHNGRNAQLILGVEKINSLQQQLGNAIMELSTTLQHEQIPEKLLNVQSAAEIAPSTEIETITTASTVKENNEKFDTMIPHISFGAVAKTLAKPVFEFSAAEMQEQQQKNKKCGENRKILSFSTLRTSDGKINSNSLISRKSSLLIDGKSKDDNNNNANNYNSNNNIIDKNNPSAAVVFGAGAATAAAANGPNTNSNANASKPNELFALNISNGHASKEQQPGNAIMELSTTLEHEQIPAKLLNIQNGLEITRSTKIKTTTTTITDALNELRIVTEKTSKAIEKINEKVDTASSLISCGAVAKTLAKPVFKFSATEMKEQQQKNTENKKSNENRTILSFSTLGISDEKFNPNSSITSKSALFIGEKSKDDNNNSNNTNNYNSSNKSNNKNNTAPAVVFGAGATIAAASNATLTNSNGTASKPYDLLTVSIHNGNVKAHNGNAMKEKALRKLKGSENNVAGKTKVTGFKFEMREQPSLSFAIQAAEHSFAPTQTHEIFKFNAVDAVPINSINDSKNLVEHKNTNSVPIKEDENGKKKYPLFAEAKILRKFGYRGVYVKHGKVYAKINKQSTPIHIETLRQIYDLVINSK